MNGFDFVADSNFLIDIHEGEDKLLPFSDSTIVISVISEIELLGWYRLKEEEKQLLRSLLDDCIIFELKAEIRTLAIEIRQQKKIKTPDGIIAATAKYLKYLLLVLIRGLKIFPV